MKKMYFLSLSVMTLLLSLVACADKGNEPERLVPLTYETPETYAEYDLTLPPDVEAVDLGIGLKWASCNLGAKSPDDFGGYFAWGDPTGKCWSLENIYILYDEKDSCFVRWQSTNYGGMKPPTHIAGTAMDIVTINWGRYWRLPTMRESLRLVYECDWTLEDHDGKKVYKVTGPNGNHIYMPLAGLYGYHDQKTIGYMHENTIGTWWTDTSVLHEDGSYATEAGVYSGWTFVANDQGHSKDDPWFLKHIRNLRFSIRPVENTIPVY